MQNVNEYFSAIKDLHFFINPTNISVVIVEERWKFELSEITILVRRLFFFLISTELEYSSLHAYFGRIDDDDKKNLHFHTALHLQ